MHLSCRACGSRVDPLGPSPWACPRRGSDGADHVLVVPAPPESVPRGDQLDDDPNPFLRYRRRLASYRSAIGCGLGDAEFVDLVGRVDASVSEVDGGGFTVTPFGAFGGVFVKDETGNVAGSHKARHLMGLALWLELRRRVGAEDPDRLAIASCGNAALAAAVVARAIDRRLDVFVPDWADPVVLTRLGDLGARVRVCERRPGELGDPCVVAFRDAVAEGAVPFACSGPDVGLTIDGGRTVGWELAEQLTTWAARPGAGRQVPSRVLVQVGGGALATAVLDGLSHGGASLPVAVVQTERCAPFDRAWRRVVADGLRAAVADRASTMRPWETVPSSAATGILDDETYDWAGVAGGLCRNVDGSSLVVTEERLLAANEWALANTPIDVSVTGSAGLAGAMERMGSRWEPQPGAVAIFTGVRRG